MRSNIHDMEVIYIRETPSAFCIREHEDATDIWLPKSRCELEPIKDDHLTIYKAAMLTCETNLLIEKGLV